MRKASLIIGGVVVIAILVGVGLALSHNSSSNPPVHRTGTHTTTDQTQPAKAPTVHNAVLTTKTDPRLGQYLADPQGKPLYTYGGDKANAGTSTCTGSCLAEWPAYRATSTAHLPAGVATIKRSDNGQTQYTYNGLPLYYFITDQPGKVTGDGVENFHLAKPAAATAPATSSSSNSSASPAYPY